MSPLASLLLFIPWVLPKYRNSGVVSEGEKNGFLHKNELMTYLFTHCEPGFFTAGPNTYVYIYILMCSSLCCSPTFLLQGHYVILQPPSNIVCCHLRRHTSEVFVTFVSQAGDIKCSIHHPRLFSPGGRERRLKKLLKDMQWGFI